MFLSIAYRILLPIALMVGVGVVLERRFRLDIPTLAKLNFNVFVPALVLAKLLDADVSPGLMARVGGFCVLQAGVLAAISYVVYALRPFRPQRTMLGIASVFYNAGNYGIPLTVLAFGEQFVPIIAIVVMTQNILSFTLGVWALERKRGAPRQMLANLLRVPVVYVVVIGLGMRWLGLDLVPPVKSAVGYLGDGLIPIALLTLGVQLARCRPQGQVSALSAVALMRLVVSPLIAAGLVHLLGFSGPTAALLVVAAGLPVAVNVYILSAEYSCDEEVASQAIFWTTLLSPITISLSLMLFR